MADQSRKAAEIDQAQAERLAPMMKDDGIEIGIATLLARRDPDADPTGRALSFNLNCGGATWGRVDETTIIAYLPFAISLQMTETGDVPAQKLGSIAVGFQLTYAFKESLADKPDDLVE